MSQYQKQKIEEQYQKLPDALKDALLGVDTANKIFEIGRKTKLTIEKVGFLAEEVGYVILGLTRPEDFVQILAERLETAATDAQSIAKEINSQIFYPLREALKAAHQIEITEPESGIKNQELRAVAPAPPMPRPVLPTPTPQPIPKPPVPTPSAIQKPQFVPVKPPSTPTPSKEFSPPAAIFPPKIVTTPPVAPKTAPPVQPPPPRVTPAAPPPVPPKMPATIKPAESVKPPEPVKPPLPATPKVPPLDLRRSKPERMREAIFAPPVEPQTTVPAETKKEPLVAKPPEPQPEKKAPYKGYDPYKEPTE